MNELKNIVRRLRETKVLENYSFMTALSICSALIGLVIYPYVIRVVGKEMYGTYVYAITIMSYFLIVMDFGFDSPSAKAIVQAQGNKDEYSHIVSAVAVKRPLYQIDVYTTLVDRMGIETRWHGLGRNIADTCAYTMEEMRALEALSDRLIRTNYFSDGFVVCAH